MYTVNSRRVQTTKVPHFVAMTPMRWSIHNATENTFVMNSTSLRPILEMALAATPKA